MFFHWVNWFIDKCLVILTLRYCIIVGTWTGVLSAILSPSCLFSRKLLIGLHCVAHLLVTQQTSYDHFYPSGDVRPLMKMLAREKANLKMKGWYYIGLTDRRKHWFASIEKSRKKGKSPYTMRLQVDNLILFLKHSLMWKMGFPYNNCLLPQKLLIFMGLLTVSLD